MCGHYTEVTLFGQVSSPSHVTPIVSLTCALSILHMDPPHPPPPYQSPSFPEENTLCPIVCVPRQPS